MLSNLKTPLNRFGFVLICFSLALCFGAWLINYGTHFAGIGWVAHLTLDRVSSWQQLAFRTGLAGALAGAILAYNLLSSVKRVLYWVKGQ